jgi:hypothetical protein|tara:strand:+ start:492 stop:599 length:108 start_codon:yes stop_codon:yes gene_type:complete
MKKKKIRKNKTAKKWNRELERIQQMINRVNQIEPL